MSGGGRRALIIAPSRWRDVLWNPGWPAVWCCPLQGQQL